MREEEWRWEVVETRQRNRRIIAKRNKALGETSDDTMLKNMLYSTTGSTLLLVALIVLEPQRHVASNCEGS